jgi:hypothetical protein
MHQLNDPDGHESQNGKDHESHTYSTLRGPVWMERTFS